MTQSSDAKQIARRIVREVVEDRGGVVPAAVPEHAEAEGPSAASGRAVQRPIDPEARAAARRIVEEVLASSTPVPVDAPSAPTSTVPDTDPSGAESAATPVSAAPAVVEPAPPSTPSARIARRIVDAVVAEHAARTTPPAG
ncbi:MAG: hypothetical protein JJT89_17135, partial [Nitriliruptoraceae bacterium]|nr:hypothetical protein [Nitriliruptoraceae bacterium]